MVLPFALVIAPNGGGYLIFLFPLLPIPLLCSQLHLVQLLLDLGDDFDVLTMMTVTVTMPSFAIELPANHNPCNATTLLMMTATMASPTLQLARFIWDPGGIGMSLIDPVTGIDPAAEMPLQPLLSPSPSLPSLPTVEHDNGNSLVCGVPHLPPMTTVRLQLVSVSVSTHAFVAPTVDGSNPHTLADKCRGALIQSLFHYSHPVLSRPTVPNIDS